jgi:hypothetical protein
MLRAHYTIRLRLGICPILITVPSILRRVTPVGRPLVLLLCNLLFRKDGFLFVSPYEALGKFEFRITL